MKNLKFLSPLFFALIALLIAGCARETIPTPDEPLNEETQIETDVTEAPVYSGPRIIVEGKSAERALTAEEMAAYPQATNLPTLYIDLGKTKLSSVQHGVWTSGTYTIVQDGRGIVGQPIEMKGRGNYSWSFPQKTYGLKLGVSEPLLGMNSSKKWVLITTWSDKTLLRNYITLNLASELLGMEGAVQTRYVDVYVNGKYNGLYVLSQNITLGEQQVPGDALFECEAQYRHGDCSNCIICPSGCHIIFSEPINDVSAEEREELLKTYRQLFVKADVAMTTGKGYRAYSRYIDVDSFVDWYIANELVKNYDSGFTTSCYCFAKDGKIYMGPCWDYDTCMGNQIVATCVDPIGYHVSTSQYNPWYQNLMADEDFTEALHARWTQLVDDGVIDAFMQMIDDQVENIAASEKMDHKTFRDALQYTGLRGGMSLYKYDQEVEYLKDWLTKRIAWLTSEWYDKSMSKK
ncbi:MAG: CotH kinase family protein [Clostridia bacterium]|nr:CotH kinase family protein [Clostridia bacterium]